MKWFDNLKKEVFNFIENSSEKELTDSFKEAGLNPDGSLPTPPEEV